MAVALIGNIVISIFVSGGIVGLLVWSIATQYRSLPGAEVRNVDRRQIRRHAPLGRPAALEA